MHFVYFEHTNTGHSIDFQNILATLRTAHARHSAGARADEVWREMDEVFHTL
jgi:hypothetical protein